MHSIKTLAALGVVLASASIAQAGPICASSLSSSISASAACELGSTNNDFLNPMQVNIDAMFGHMDWLFDAKDNDVDGVDEGPDSLGLSLIGDTLAGTWTINANAFSLYSDIMLVFKSGNGGSPDTYVAYLLSGISGQYASPFTNANNGNAKDISHVSIYARGTSQVSEPGVLMLFGLGAVGVGLARRRRRA